MLGLHSTAQVPLPFLSRTHLAPCSSSVALIFSLYLWAFQIFVYPRVEPKQTIKEKGRSQALVSVPAGLWAWVNSFYYPGFSLLIWKNKGVGSEPLSAFTLEGLSHGYVACQDYIKWFKFKYNTSWNICSLSFSSFLIYTILSIVVFFSSVFLL
jgi:hypothetical protein